MSDRPVTVRYGSTYPPYATQLVDPDAPSFRPVMQRIAHKHVSLGIRPEQYSIVGHNLMAAVAEVVQSEGVVAHEVSPRSRIAGGRSGRRARRSRSSTATRHSATSRSARRRGT